MVNKEEFLKLCEISRLEFSERELPRLLKDMDSLVNYTKKVSECNDSSLTPDCVRRTHRGNDDIEYEKCTREQLLSGGIQKGGFFFVKNYSK